MIPTQFSESVAIADTRTGAAALPVERCLSVCDVASAQRCKTGVQIDPTLCAVDFHDRIVCYRDSTRRHFRTSVDYEPRLRPRVYRETCFLLPRRSQSSYAALCDYAAASKAADRKWFSTAVTFAKNKNVACGGGGGGPAGVVETRLESRCNGNTSSSEGTGMGKSNGFASTTVEVNLAPVTTALGESVVLITSADGRPVVKSEIDNNNVGEGSPASISYRMRFNSSDGAEANGADVYRTRIKIDNDRVRFQ